LQRFFQDLLLKAEQSHPSLAAHLAEGFEFHEELLDKSHLEFPEDGK